MSLLEQIADRLERTDMLLEVLYSVVERTGQTSEGYFVLRQINDLSRDVSKSSDAEQMLQALDNIHATINTMIERFDR